MLDRWFKKEKPFQGLAGMGGGVVSRVLGGVPTIEILEYLIVAGGGSGGGTSNGSGLGGGGAGGLIYSSTPIQLPLGANSLTVGAGGASTNSGSNNGSPSVFGSLIAYGGGGANNPGGSGGGQNNVLFPWQSGGGVGDRITGTPNPIGGAVIQGNPGGSGYSTTPGSDYYAGNYSAGGGGGRGGAGQQGQQPPSGGGAGGAAYPVPTNIIPPSYGTPGPQPGRYFAGGGGGGARGPAGAGGGGGAGAGATADGDGGNATANSGSGGGGSGQDNATVSGGAGGSGIISFRVASGSSVTFSGGVTFTQDTSSVPNSVIYTITVASSQTVTFA